MKLFHKVKPLLEGGFAKPPHKVKSPLEGAFIKPPPRVRSLTYRMELGKIIVWFWNTQWFQEILFFTYFSKPLQAEQKIGPRDLC